MGSGTQLQRPYAARGEVDGQVPHSVPVMSAFSHHQNGPFPDVSNAAASVTNLDLDFPDLPFPVGSSAYDLSHEFLPNSRAMVVPEGLATSPAWGSIPESRQLGKTWLSRSASHEVGDAQILASRHAEIDGAGLEFATQTQRADSTGNLLEGDARGEHSWSNEKLQVKHTRRAEQNRRAQAKFRQRKKDKVSSMEMQLAAMSLHLQQVTNEKDALAQRALQLQQVVERKDAQLAAIEGQSKGSDASEDLIGAFWDMVVELKKGKPSLNCSRECIQKMVNDLLNSKSLELGFIRKEIVAQLAQCVEQGGDVEHSPANRWLNRLVTAYNKMVHRCGETNPLAFRTFLSLQLPEQRGLLADRAFWRSVVKAGSLTVPQKKQLIGAHKQLMLKMQQLMNRRDVVGVVPSNSSSRREPVLDSMHQAKEVLDLHEHILKEELLAVFKFRTTVGLALEPIQQAKLMISSFPFALDTLAICTVLAESRDWLAMTTDDMPFFSQLPMDSPFQSLASNNMPLDYRND